MMTASSAISLCPRLTSSIAVSLLPTPLSPSSSIALAVDLDHDAVQRDAGARWTLSEARRVASVVDVSSLCVKWWCCISWPSQGTRGMALCRG